MKPHPVVREVRPALKASFMQDVTVVRDEPPIPARTKPRQTFRAVYLLGVGMALVLVTWMFRT